MVMAALLIGGAALEGACGSSGGSASPGGGGTLGNGTSGASSTGASTSGGTSGGTSGSSSSGAEGSDTDAGSSGSTQDATLSACSGATQSTSVAAADLPSPPAVILPSGFTIETVASIASARELAALPNGDLLVATDQANVDGGTVMLVPNAEGTPGEPVTFATFSDTPAQGIAFDPGSCTVYVGTQHDIYAMSYVDAQQTGNPGNAIAHVRTGSISPNRPPGDTDDHTTTSVAFAGGSLYAGVGSSCNACVETDPTRAAIQVMDPSGANMTTRATRIRNAIALAANPATGTLWAGGAGQDDLPEGHPFEFFDAVTLHAGVADYGWPVCEEDHTAYTPDADCASTVAPIIELPAYSTLIGATFYPATQTGKYAFPSTYRGLFLTAHGSWHTTSTDAFYSPPRVAFVMMNGDAPATPVDWTNPSAQWTEFVGGYQLANGMTRVGRPTGIAVGSEGSLFVADDQNGAVYRIRPN